MPVTILIRKKEYQVSGGVTVRQALEKLQLSPQSHLALRDGELLTEDVVLREGDIVKLVAVISGGQI